MAEGETAKGPVSKMKSWSFSIDFETIGWLILDVPDKPVNALDGQTLIELESLVGRLEELAASDELCGVVLLSGKDSGFVAGADISEFNDMTDPAALGPALDRAHQVFDRLEALPVPVVAGISGFCLGGGLELALACHYRIAVNSDKTRLGFPEVRLGLFPGFGGTGRSIRQAGPVAAMQAMLTGKAYAAKAARRLNLVDKLVRHRDQLRWEARKAVLGNKRSKAAGWTKRVMAMGPMRTYTANKMREATRRKVNPDHYPAPYSLIDLYAEHGHDPVAMRRGEQARFMPLMASDTARNLRRVFFLSEGLKKQGVRDARPKFARVHVIGAGVMGGDIAAWCAYRGMDVSLQDLDLGRIEPALARAKKLFRRRLKTRREVDAAMSRLRPDVEGNGLSRADVVIEAVVENIDIKRKIFAEAEAKAHADAILATNTSSIELERIAEVLPDPERLIGLHFFNPVSQLPLVEVIQSKFNTEHTVRMGCSFALAIAKSPVVVKSAPGFLVNHVLMPYLMGAVHRLEEGARPELLDRAAVAFGMPVGPIELLDVVGLDVAKLVAEELGNEVHIESRMAQLIAEGHLGRKTGQGFYTWRDGKAQKGDPGSDADLDSLGRDLVKPLADTAERVVANKVVANADLADIGIILGTGFAPFLGGPLQARKDGKV